MIDIQIDVTIIMQFRSTKGYRLCRASLDQGTVPLDWKKAFVIPTIRRETVHYNTAQYLLRVSSIKHLSILSQLISTHILVDMTSLLTINMASEVKDHVKLN